MPDLMIPVLRPESTALHALLEPQSGPVWVKHTIVSAPLTSGLGIDLCPSFSASLAAVMESGAEVPSPEPFLSAPGMTDDAEALEKQKVHLFLVPEMRNSAEISGE